MSAFIELVNCPICGTHYKKPLFFDRAFDAPEVVGFLTRYYEGRVPVELFRGERFQIAHCSECDFYWHVRVLREDLASELYERWIDPAKSRSKHEAHTVEERLHRCHLVARWLESTTTQSAPHRVLDLGGGWGATALCAKALGCEALVLETSRSRQAHLRADGLRVVASLNEEDTGKVDLIVMNQSLEHIPGPRLFLEQALRLLRAGGGVAIDLPRADPGAEVLAKGPFQPLEHVNGFTQRALERLVQVLGLKVKPDYSRYARVGPRGVLSAVKRNLTLMAGTRPSGPAVAIFASKPY